MITLEANADGFDFRVDGKGVFSHTTRRPCAELGASRGGRAADRTASRDREGRIQYLPLRSCRILESSPASAVLDFEGKLRLNAHLEGGRLRIAFERPSDRFDRLRFRLTAVPGESIFGCGERFGPLNLKGSRVGLWVEDRGSGREICPVPLPVNLRRNARRSCSTYFPQPSFVSSEKYWVHADTSSLCRFDFRASRVTLLEFRRVPREIVIGWGERAPDAVAGLARHVGRPPAVPGWTRRGAVLGVRGGMPEVRRKLAAAREAGAPVSAVWVQDWCGQRSTRQGVQAYWNWTADTELYPDLSGEIASLRAEGVRFLGYIAPFLALDGSLYAEARERGLCVRSSGGGDYTVGTGGQSFALLDLTNPRTLRWIKDVIRTRMIEAGMAGWLADFGECLPEDAVLSSGAHPRELHNEWPVLWARVNREAVEEARASDEIAVFLRSGWAGSSSLASGFWAGSQVTDFGDAAGMTVAVPAALSAGLSGAGFLHFEAGGCVSSAFGVRKPECLRRWFELGAFSPLFRTHEGSRPLANSQYWTDPDSLRHFARMAGIFAALEPYHAVVARECEETGLPPVRHLWMHYEDDPEARFMEHQYLYGRDLMVAPVFRRGQVLKQAWLPKDRWVHFWTSRTFRGGPVILEAQPGYPLVFYREESRFASLFDSIRRTARKP